MKLQIGDIVKNIVWGQEGQIMTEYENYWEVEKEKGQFITRTPSAWLQEQTVPFTTEQINEERWFSVHCFDGGSILCCESRLEFIDRIDAQKIVNDCKHEVSKVKCDLCGKEWVAVRPEGLTKLECPDCGNMANFENV
jgi:hypothetical protein